MKSILKLNTTFDFNRSARILYNILGELETIPRVGEKIVIDCINEKFLIGVEDGVFVKDVTHNYINDTIMIDLFEIMAGDMGAEHYEEFIEIAKRKGWSETILI